jgi:hypothetical protein
MNLTSEDTHTSRINDVVGEIFGPVRAAPGTPRHRLLLARSVVAYLGLVSTLVQIVVWLMMAVVTADLASPWWLWTTVPAAAAVGGLTMVDLWRDWWVTATRAGSRSDR